MHWSSSHWSISTTPPTSTEPTFISVRKREPTPGASAAPPSGFHVVIPARMSG
jgi:hypothetical protein